MKVKEKVRRRIFNIIQLGSRDDLPSCAFDIFIVFAIMLNLFLVLFSTFEQSKQYSDLIYTLELITIIAFTIEYILRLWTADFLYPGKTKLAAICCFFFSFYGLIDFFSFMPFYLPFVFPSGTVAFRMLRVIRIFRLFKVNATYDAFNVIVDVLKEKKDQILSSVVMILILMVAASLAMYSLEHDAQPEVFSNAFSGIWWATSTLLTIGYGDIYPVTLAGKMLSMIISFLGVGMVAIPTGIISAGFVEQYTKKSEKKDSEGPIKEVVIADGNLWIGNKVIDIDANNDGKVVVAIQRGGSVISASEELIIEKDDKVFIYEI